MKNVLAKVVMLPTEKANKQRCISKCIKSFDLGMVEGFPNKNEKGKLNYAYPPSTEFENWYLEHYQYFHLYFTTDEEIKEGDYVHIDTLDNDNKGRITVVLSLKGSHPVFNIEIKEGISKLSLLKKIVASTDESLGLPKPSNDFLKSYCEKGGIDEVFVVYTNHEQETGEFAHSDEELICYIKVAPNNTIIIK